MAIPASKIVDVEPRTITGGSENLEMNGLLLDKNDSISTDTMVLSFSSANAVGEYFGTASLEYETASVYFTSYDNKFAAPRAFLVARRVDEDCPAWIRSAKTDLTLADVNAVENGVIRITINGIEIERRGLDFTTTTSFSDLAERLAAEIAGADLDMNGAYSSQSKTFTFATRATGEECSISYAEPWGELTGDQVDLAVLLGLTESAGAVISQGMNALDEAGQMTAIRKATENWVSFTTAWEADTEEALRWAQWASQNFGWLYVPHTYEATAVSQESDADMASRIKAAGYDHVAVVYGSLAYSAFLMGCVGSVPWDRTNGTITFAFKKQSGLAALVTDETEADVLQSKNCNFYGIWATRNADFAFLYDGVLSASDYGYIDPYINQVWLTNRLQVSIMDGLTLAARVPYTDRGYTMIRAWMMDPINEGLNNRAIEPGVSLSESQKSELFNEAGMDITNELWTQGYFIQILDPGASVRAQRGTPIVNFWYCYAGAVHKISVASTVVL